MLLFPVFTTELQDLMPQLLLHWYSGGNVIIPPAVEGGSGGVCVGGGRLSVVCVSVLYDLWGLLYIWCLSWGASSGLNIVQVQPAAHGSCS